MLKPLEAPIRPHLESKAARLALHKENDEDATMSEAPSPAVKRELAPDMEPAAFEQADEVKMFFQTDTWHLNHYLT